MLFGQILPFRNRHLAGRLEAHESIFICHVNFYFRRDGFERGDKRTGDHSRAAKDGGDKGPVPAGASDSHSCG